MTYWQNHGARPCTHLVFRGGFSPLAPPCLRHWLVLFTPTHMNTRTPGPRLCYILFSDWSAVHTAFVLHYKMLLMVDMLSIHFLAENTDIFCRWWSPSAPSPARLFGRFSSASLQNVDHQNCVHLHADHLCLDELFVFSSHPYMGNRVLKRTTVFSTTIPYTVFYNQPTCSRLNSASNWHQTTRFLALSAVAARWKVNVCRARTSLRLPIQPGC